MFNKKQLIELLEATVEHFDQVQNAEVEMYMYYEGHDKYEVPNKDEIYFCTSPACAAGHAVCSPKVRTILYSSMTEEESEDFEDLEDLAMAFNHIGELSSLASYVAKSICHPVKQERKINAELTNLFTDEELEYPPKHLVTNDLELEDVNNYIKLLLKKLKGK